MTSAARGRNRESHSPIPPSHPSAGLSPGRWRRTRHERPSTDLSSVGLRGGRPGKPGSAGRPEGRRLPRRPAAARRIATPTGALQTGEAASGARNSSHPDPTSSPMASPARGSVAATYAAGSFTNCSVNLSWSWCPHGVRQRVPGQHERDSRLEDLLDDSVSAAGPMRGHGDPMVRLRSPRRPTCDLRCAPGPNRTKGTNTAKRVRAGRSDVRLGA
jgi:hypothetical protein